MTFGSLYLQFGALENAGDEFIRVGIIASLEKQWAACDKGVSIAAVILNPFIKIAPFKRCSDLVSLASIYGLFSGLWKRLFQTSEVPTDLYTDLRNYLSNKGEYEGLIQICAVLRGQAEIDVCAF